MTVAQRTQDTTHRSEDRAAELLSQDQLFLRSTEVPDYDAGAASSEIVDLFCGCGGLTYGALEGFRHAGRSAKLSLAVDLESAPLEILESTLGLSADRCKAVDLSETLQEIGGDATPEESELFDAIGGEALLLAGPPCQGHSALNNHTRHDDPRNDLYMAVARAADLIEPRAVVSENVSGVSSDKKRSMTRCMTALEDLGYEVVEKRLDLRAVGVPQRRIRHVLVATKDKKFDWEQLASVPNRDVAWAIDDLLDRKPSSAFDTASQASKKNIERINWLFDEGEYDLPNERRPDCHQDGEHSYVSMYGRLRWDRPAQTITSGFGSMGQGRFVHPRRRRTLTPHEAARLQCLPDFVAFDAVEVTRSALATMIGNVAPPLLATRIVEALVAQELL
jgi:DNA (cytosine-5)-methyltransferase 1